VSETPLAVGAHTAAVEFAATVGVQGVGLSVCRVGEHLGYTAVVEHHVELQLTEHRSVKQSSKQSSKQSAFCWYNEHIPLRRIAHMEMAPFCNAFHCVCIFIDQQLFV
jgi:hypothetical protein